jgi:hypothetical protein
MFTSKEWIMKKWPLFLVTVLCSNHLYAFDAKNNEIAIAHGLDLAFESKREENKELNYKVDIKYPQLSGDAVDAAGRQFNEKMNQFTISETTEFASKVADSHEQSIKLPAAVQQNYFNLNFNASVFKAKDQMLMGIRFNKEYFYAGNAHPMHDIEVYNYNLSTGKDMKLGEIFTPNSEYLKFISNYCRIELTKRLKVMHMKLIPEGVAPQAENFINWNTEPDGLLFTFDENQVAPYAAGQPEVFISYKTLKEMISPGAPIAICLKDPKSCIAV